ncbi:hypothetical protein N499_0377B, partial [Wolbachia pipientis wVitA]
QEPKYSLLSFLKESFKLYYRL